MLELSEVRLWINRHRNKVVVVLKTQMVGFLGYELFQPLAGIGFSQQTVLKVIEGTNIVKQRRRALRILE